MVKSAKLSKATNGLYYCMAPRDSKNNLLDLTSQPAKIGKGNKAMYQRRADDH